MPSVTIKLTAPCPRCGNTKKLGIFGFDDDCWVTCPVCGFTNDGGATIEEAVDDWNNTAPPGGAG